MQTMMHRMPLAMKHERLGKTPLMVAPIALGTAAFGSSITQEMAFAILDSYSAAGGNLLDTAHIYAAWLPRGWGASERTIGIWMRSRQSRHEMIISTKGAHPPIDELDKPRLRPEFVRQDLHESLDRLGTYYVDLYWMHRDDPDIPVGEIIDTLNQEMRAGLIRAIGCSNWSASRQREAMEYATRTGQAGFCASQIGWSLARRKVSEVYPGCLDMDHDMYGFHKETGIPVLAYTSQALGFFSGKYEPRQTPSTDREAMVAQSYFSDENFRRLTIARRIAEDRGATANEIALAWLRHHPFQTIPIIGPNHVDQLTNSLGAAELDISDGQFSELSSDL